MISIIIPNYDRFDLLYNCINSLLIQHYHDFEVIVVDNGSKNIEIKPIADIRIKFIWLSKNKGFSKAINLGINEAKGDYIAILNNDTEVHRDWLGRIYDLFVHNTELIFITSKIVHLLDNKILDDVGDVVLSTGKVYKIGNRELDKGQYDRISRTFAASGCASVYRREFFDKVGYFDEDFFAYLEDIDLSFRANLLGYKCLYVPDAVVYHVGSATTGSKYNPFTIFHLAQNTINVIVKNFPTRILIKNLPKMLLHIISMQIYFTFKGHGWSFLKGFISGLRMLPVMLEKRKQIMKSRIITDKQLEELLKENIILYKRSKKNRVK